MMIKLSDYIFDFLYEKGIKDIFMLPGGGAMHLVDSLGKSKINYVHCQHEQAASIAALAYGEHTGHLGVALVTSGPGSTNAVTGVAAGWVDSVPMLLISGQAKRADLVGDKKVRQMGTQEIMITEIVKPITKYSVQVLDPETIRYHLERCYEEATTGRKGPVWIDLPLDVQSAMIEPSELQSYSLPAVSDDMDILGAGCDVLIDRIMKASKPVILAGYGVTSCGASELFDKMLHNIRIPVLTTWKAMDLLAEDHPLYAGRPGVMGDRGANMIIQNCDLLISIGARIDNTMTAYNEMNFSPGSYKIIIDVDPYELKKFRMNVDLTICENAYNVIECIIDKTKDTVIEKNEWIDECKQIRNKYPLVNDRHRNKTNPISGYFFIERLSDLADEDDVIVPESAGVTAEVTLQSFKTKAGQKNKHASCLGSMGFGLPYSIGACLANNRRRTVLINGDGAFQLNIQELETLKRLNLPVKIFVWNNNGYASIRGMQRNNFNGNYVGCDVSSGCTMPNIGNIAKAYGLNTFSISSNDETDDVIKKVLDSSGPVLCEVAVDPDEIVGPKVVSKMNENGEMIPGTLDNMWPYLE